MHFPLTVRFTTLIHGIGPIQQFFKAFLERLNAREWRKSEDTVQVVFEPEFLASLNDLARIDREEVLIFVEAGVFGLP